MVELKAEEHCRDCLEFVPEAETPICRNNDKIGSYTAVLHANWNLCAH